MGFEESLRRVITTPEAVRLLASHIRDALAGAVSVQIESVGASDQVVLYQQPGTEVCWVAGNRGIRHGRMIGKSFGIPRGTPVSFQAIEDESRMRLDPAGVMRDIASTGLLDIQDQIQAMLTDLASHHGGDRLAGKVVLYGDPQVEVWVRSAGATRVRVDWKCGAAVYTAPSDPPPLTSQEWIAWAGGSDANNCATSQVFAAEADAWDAVQWMDGSYGRGLAVRTVTCTPWIPVEHEHSVAWAGADNDG